MGKMGSSSEGDLQLAIDLGTGDPPSLLWKRGLDSLLQRHRWLGIVASVETASGNQDMETILPVRPNSVIVMKLVAHDIDDEGSLQVFTEQWNQIVKQIVAWQASGIDSYVFFDCPCNIPQTQTVAQHFCGLLRESNVNIADPLHHPAAQIQRTKIHQPSQQANHNQENEAINNPDLIKLKEELDHLDKLPEEFSDNRIVFFRGNPNADIVCIGEAPGTD